MKDQDEKRGIGRAAGAWLWASGRAGSGDDTAPETTASERCTKKAIGVESEGLDQAPGKTLGFQVATPRGT